MISSLRPLFLDRSACFLESSSIKQAIGFRYNASSFSSLLALTPTSSGFIDAVIIYYSINTGLVIIRRKIKR
jgi:hypothetical protein